jgi:hypothetical protein
VDLHEEEKREGVLLKLSFLIPYQSNGDKDRRRAFEFVKARIAHLWPDAEICIGKDDSGVSGYSKPRMINNAARKATGDILVIIDADVICPREAIDQAVRLIESGEANWVIPFGSVKRLSGKSTNKLLAGNPDTDVYPDEAVGGSQGPGAINVLPRAAWKAVGGYDEGFKDWGVEDAAFVFALDKIYGVHTRLDEHEAYHLWHNRLTGMRRKENSLRFKRYKQFASEPDKLLDLMHKQQYLGEPVDFLTFLKDRRQYIDHMLPVWNALPREIRGNWIVGRKMAAYAISKGIEGIVVAEHPGGTINALKRSSGLVVVAGHTDPKVCECAERPNVVMYHGTGFNFDGRRSLQSYPGTKQFRKLTRLMLVPSERVAEIERQGNPSIPVEIVGVPKLDQWQVRPKKSMGDNPVVALAWHWRCKVAPCTGTAFDHYEPVLGELAKHYKVIGHGHPHILDELTPKYKAMGIEVVRNLTKNPHKPRPLGLGISFLKSACII